MRLALNGARSKEIHHAIVLLTSAVGFLNLVAVLPREEDLRNAPIRPT